ncbi:MAG: NAD-dependent epimerase/dehydratase family protein [Lapillicoccus sp.]
MSDQRKVVVFGATGFVGTAVAQALRTRGAVVVPMSAPRLPPTRPERVEGALGKLTDDIAALAQRLAGADCLVNAAGAAEAASPDEDSLTAANAMLPGYLGMAATLGGVPRFVHVSSAAVQGRTRVLDSSASVTPFSPYSRSKALGEQLARRAHTGTVVYRPPGVHGADRRVSRVMARVARSPLASVARPGSSPTPQTLLANVGDAIAFLATTTAQPPAIVAHPSEGLTTAGLMVLLGGRPPREVPRALARVVVAILSASAQAVPQAAANARRLEMLWFGQSQAPSWLTQAGWSPPAGRAAWQELGRQLGSGSRGRRRPHGSARRSAT